MKEDDKEELKALVVGFLQQGLKEHPQGFNVWEFEKEFPVKCDEPHDWYKRYGKNNAVEALECIPDVVKITYNNRSNTKFISLNQKSDKVDSHLVDLITNQRSSTKKKSGGRPSSRALLSFSLNRQYSASSRNKSYTTRLNHDQQYRGENSYTRRDSNLDHSTFSGHRSSSYSKQPSSWIASHDPRARSSALAPPQIKLGPSQPVLPCSSSAPAPAFTSNTTSVSAQRTKQVKPIQTASAPVPRVKPSKVEAVEQASKEENPALVSKKHYVRQRICSLLTRKYREIKILHLAALYKLEYEESLDSCAFGYPNITSLLNDPLLKSHIQINYSPMITISIKHGPISNGKENEGVSNTSEDNCSKSNGTTPGHLKFDAIDKFNLRNMTQSLESFVVKESNHAEEIDEQVKYKTMRMIFRSPEQILRLEDWSAKFYQETKLMINVRIYGFKTLFEFFKHLAKEIPITVRLNKNDDWIAATDLNSVSKWLNDKMSKGEYRALIVMDSYYELIAFPGDSYTFSSIKDIDQHGYYPAFILSVKQSTSLWIQLRTSKRIEEHLCVEASMTCYEDYKNRDLLSAPKALVRPGFPCAIYDTTQQRWCRALILRAPEKTDNNSEVTALLVDYGVTRSFSVQNLLCLMKTHLRLPVGPIYSKLAGVNDENDLVLQHRAKYILHEYTNPPVTLACKFLREITQDENLKYLPRKLYEVALVDTRSGKDCNLAEDINLPRDSE